MVLDGLRCQLFVGGLFECLEAVANLADILCELAEVFLDALRELLQVLRRLVQRVDVVGVALDIGILYSLVFVGGVFESLEVYAGVVSQVF